MIGDENTFTLTSPLHILKHLTPYFHFSLTLNFLFFKCRELSIKNRELSAQKYVMKSKV